MTNTTKDGKLSGKVALVTGSSYGIGRGIALEMAKEGATVLITGRRETEINKTIDMIHAMGGTAYGRTMDVSRKEEIDKFFSEFVEPHGLDIFVNNAGITVIKSFVDNTQEELERICSTNLMGACYCIQNAARMMIRNGTNGNIVLVTSCNAMAPLPHQSFYSALKCALEGLVRGIAWEFKDYGIRVNTVAPGCIVSGMTVDCGVVANDDLAKTIPVPRYGQPEDIGKAVVFLASDDASYVNGTSLVVDGGLILRGDG